MTSRRSVQLVLCPDPTQLTRDPFLVGGLGLGTRLIAIVLLNDLMRYPIGSLSTVLTYS